MGFNLSFLRSKYEINFHSHSLAHCIKVATTVEQLNSQPNCLIEQLQILLRTTRNESVINGFTHNEITELIREIACHNCTIIINLYCNCINVSYYIITVAIVFLYTFMYTMLYLLCKITIK